jgi:signal transduction histidine kinase
MAAEPPKKGLRRRIVLAFLLVGFIPVLVALLVTYWTGTQHLQEAMGQNFQGLAVEAARKIDMVIEREIEGKRHLSATAELRADLRAANREYTQRSDAEITRALDERRDRWESGQHSAFRQQVLLNPTSGILRGYMRTMGLTYLQFFVTDTQGAIVASANESPRYLNRDQPWWRETYNAGLGKNYIGDLYFSDPDQAWALVTAVPVMDDKSQRAIGVLAVVHDVRELLQAPIHAIQFGESGHAMLIDSDGRVLTCPFLPTGTLLQDHTLVASVTSATPNWVMANDDGHGGTGSIIGFAPAEATSMVTNASTGKRWHSFIRQDPKELYAPIDSLLWSATSSGVVLITFVALMGLVLSKRLAKPIQQLQQGAEQIGKGNLDVTLAIRTNDEIEQLAGAFNEMAGRLRESHATLEQRVLERTSQLSALNLIAATTNRSLELQEIVESALEPILDVMQFQRGAIWLWNAEEDRLVLQASRGVPPELIKRCKEIAAGKMTVGEVAGSGRRIIVEEARRGVSPDALIAEHGCTSLVAIPLVSKGRILGAFSGACQGPRQFSQQHLSLLESMCSHLSVSIDNAKLYSRTRAMVEQLREAERFKEAFFSNISHELRTPLTSIIGYSEALLARMAGELNARQTEAVTNIHNSGALLLEIVSNLLDLSKIRAGKMEVHFGEFSMKHLITNCLKDVDPLASQKGLELAHTLGDDSLMVHADQIKVKQVLLNLLSNAIKFTPHGGRIQVEARDAVFEGQPAIEVSVIDQGIGLKEEDVERIFEEFTQVDSSFTRAYGGTGLGLPIVKQFVEMHGGRVTVTSQIGQGCRFTFVIPKRIEIDPLPTDTADNGHSRQGAQSHSLDAAD